MEKLPEHLKKYVVEQDYEKYTPVDHSVWRFILRQLKAYLKTHAHDCYLDGLEKTGISIDLIPKISDISHKISKLGWKALPVSGFIPPAAFMELQSLGVLPIASEIRSLDHLLYTPAPDIVHEAAGHAPILVDPEFANYLREYAQVAKKSIISSEDLEVYEAIRSLSDIKENPTSTSAQIAEAEKKLNEVTKKMSSVSEAAQLARMNWWTAEYGLIGSLENPKIFGAGLLSSVGEAKLCLSSKVKKIPLTVDCVNFGYDITEPQPQLFVTPNFQHLSKVLCEFSKTMAFNLGGISGVKKAVESKSVNTAELDSGIQVSGQIVEVLTSKAEQIIYLKTLGPSQLSYSGKEIVGHSRHYHEHGFGTPLGSFKQFPDISPALLTNDQWKSMGIEFEVGVGKQKSKSSQPVHLEFSSGISIKGTIESRYLTDGKTIILTLSSATANLKDTELFRPEWGFYDIVLGLNITSVFGGAADRLAYGEFRDFVVSKVPKAKFSEKDLLHHQLYRDSQSLRGKKTETADFEKKLKHLYEDLKKNFTDDWLLFLEVYELSLTRPSLMALSQECEAELKRISKNYPEKAPVIGDGIALAKES